MSLASPSQEALARGAAHLLAGKYFQIASYVVLIYDHGLTFSEEVDRIWTQKFTGATVLFLINRYVTPLEFLIVVDAFFDPSWSKETCDRFVKYEGAGTVALIGICELIMILRVYALYGRSIPVLIGLLFLLIIQICISSVGISTGYAVPGLDQEPLFGCILTGTSILFPSVWVAPLVTDSCIFFLTLWRTQRHFRSASRARIIRVFLRDGILYFFVIFLTNLMNTMLFFIAPADLKAIGASFSQLITSVMVSRLILNLRGVPLPSNHDRTTGGISRHSQYPDTTFMTLMSLGNLGEELDVVEEVEEDGNFHLG